MTGFVISDGFLLFGRNYLVFLLKSAHNAVDGIEKILLFNFLFIVTGGNQCGLVADIGNVGTREARCLLGQRFGCDIRCQFGQRTQMNFEDIGTLIKIRQLNLYLTVEAAGAHQGAVENVGTVGCCKNYHTAVGAETVHLCEQLIKCVLALVVSAPVWIFTTGTADCVNLVDEDDARRFLFGLFEQVAHTRCTHTHKHLDKIGTRKREERHVSLAGNGFGQQRLACSRGAYKQSTLWNLAAKLCIFLRIL